MAVVAFCGIDGCGKSTYIEELRKVLHIEFEVVDPMKGGVYGKELKELLNIANKDNLTPSKYKGVVYALDLLECFLNKISINYLVISHRHWLCCRSYAIATNSDSLALAHIISSVPKPDLIFYLDVDIDVACDRINRRHLETGKKIAPKEQREVLLKAQINYTHLINENPDGIVIVNANESPENNLEFILSKIQNIIAK